jgi:hypothetical protein
MSDDQRTDAASGGGADEAGAPDTGAGGTAAPGGGTEGAGGTYPAEKLDLGSAPIGTSRGIPAGGLISRYVRRGGDGPRRAPVAVGRACG